MLDTMRKIMDRVIYKRSLSIVESNNGLSECQFEFCHARSTVDAVIMVVNQAKDEFSYSGCCAGLVGNSADLSRIEWALTEIGVQIWSRIRVPKNMSSQLRYHRTQSWVPCYGTSCIIQLSCFPSKKRPRGSGDPCDGDNQSE